MKGQQIGVRSLVSARTGEPRIVLHVGDVAPQLTPRKAREVALAILEAAEAAEQDAALVAFCNKKLDLDDRFAAGVLRMLRANRKAPPDWEITEEEGD